MRGDGSELLGIVSPCENLVSSGEPATVWASRRPLGVIGACCRILGLRIEGSRDAVPEGGEEGRREVMVDYCRVSVCIGFGNAYIQEVRRCTLPGLRSGVGKGSAERKFVRDALGEHQCRRCLMDLFSHNLKFIDQDRVNDHCWSGHSCMTKAVQNV